MAVVGSGLMSTFTPSTTNAARVCYQLLYGFARGMILQQPVTAIQANVPKHQMAIGTALIGVTQNFGAALFVSLAQTIFMNSLRSALATFAPEVDAKKVISVGATSFRTVVSESSVPKVILAYNKALTATFVRFSFFSVRQLYYHVDRQILTNRSSTCPSARAASLSPPRGVWDGRI